VTFDGIYSYLYDADGRICAVANTPMPGMTTMTGYVYDASGTRVAKGTITVWSCDPGVNGLATSSDYILGLGGEQVTEMGVNSTVSGSTTTNSLTWQHTNVWAGGKLLGTYDKDGLHFYFDDPLGTRRAQTDSAGVIEQSCQSLPFGDTINNQPPCSSGSFIAPTEQFFTGKERDTESGNDYFGARYYASSMGRFMSPDWSAKAEPVPYAKLDNPQSLNLYAYVGNNPLIRTDPTGHYVCSGTKDQCAAIQTGLNLAKAAQDKLGADSKGGKAIGAVLKFYGAAGEKNGVNVGFASMKQGQMGTAELGKDGHSVNIKFDLGQINSVGSGSTYGAGYTSLGLRAGIAIHEGTHGVDERKMGHNPQTDAEEDRTEHNAYRNESYTYHRASCKIPQPRWARRHSRGVLML